MQPNWLMIGLAIWYTAAFGILIHISFQSIHLEIYQIKTRLTSVEQQVAALQADQDTQVASIWESLDEAFVIVEKLQQLPHYSETFAIDQLEIEPQH